MRILSLHPVTTELVFALGAGPMVVGRCEACDYPQSAQTVPSIGEAAAVTPESAGVFEPDIILLSHNQEEIARRLSNFRTLVIAPTSVAEVCATLRMLGDLLGKSVEADMLVHDIERIAEHAKEKTAGFHKINVHIEQENAWSSPLFLNDIISLAGGTSYPGGDITSLKQFNPNIIIGVGNDERFLERMAGRAGWNELLPVQHERMFLFEDGVLRPTPRAILGLRKMAKLLHGVELNGN